MVMPPFPLDNIEPPIAPLGQMPVDPVMLIPMPPPRPVISDLDKWAKRKHNLFADELEGGPLRELCEYVHTIARQDKEYWKERDSRMRTDHDTFRLAQVSGSLGKDNKTEAELTAENAQMVTLPDPYLYVSKITNMIAGAGLQMHMPSSRTSNTQSAQDVENFCQWFWKELSDRQLYSGGTDPLRRLGAHGGLRGWMTILTMPNSEDDEFPYHIEFEDPLYVYPRFSRSTGGPIRVTRQYRLSALEARHEYPELVMLQDEGRYPDDQDVSIIGYYDSIYHFIMVEGREQANNQYELETLNRPMQHGLRDLEGRPQLPWIIVIPLGDLTAPSEGTTSTSTALYGPGILYGMHEVYNHINRAASMLLTNVAKSVDPASVTYIRAGSPAPEPIALTPGSRNYLIMDQHEVKLLDTAPNPGNLQPALEILTDRLNKATLPSVFYGESGSVTSGYGVSLLTNAAMDILRPYTRALEAAIRLMMRRVLEITYNVTRETHGSLQITAVTGVMQRQVSGIEFDPNKIIETGTRLDIKFGEVTPQDKAAAANYVTALVTAGILSRYDARVELGFADPLLMFQRQALESLLMDPMIAQQLGPLAAYNTDEELLLKAVQVKQEILNQQRMMEEQARQQGQPALRTSTLPTEAGERAGQVPQGQEPGATTQEGTDRNLANMLAMQGGSPPAV